MHELAVTESILNIAVQHASQAGAVRVTDLHLVIGQLSSIVDDSVQFYWDMISEGTICAGAELHFERRPATLKCLDCDQDLCARRRTDRLSQLPQRAPQSRSRAKSSIWKASKLKRPAIWRRRQHDDDRVTVVEKILSANDRLAEQNRARLDQAGIFGLNIMAAPGAGKTSTILRTIKALAPQHHDRRGGRRYRRRHDRCRQGHRGRDARRADQHRRRVPPRRGDAERRAAVNCRSIRSICSSWRTSAT